MAFTESTILRDSVSGDPIKVETVFGGNKYLGVSMCQDVETDTDNSSSTPLNAGAAFTGTAVTTLGIGVIQVSFYSDKTHTVVVQQSTDGTNWDFVNSFYAPAANAKYFPIQSIGAKYRVLATNTASTNASVMRLATYLLPVGTPSHVALGDHNGANSLIDFRTGFRNSVSPMGSQFINELTRLIGSTFSGPTIDTRFWTASAGGGAGAAIAQADNQIVLTSGTASNTCSVTSLRISRYIAGSANRFRAVVQVPAAGTANNIKRWGAYDASNGYFFELNGTAFSVVARKGTTDTPVLSGAFSDSNFTLDTSVHTYEIIYNNSQALFIIDNILRHTIRATTATTSATLHLPITLENNNSGAASTTDLQVRVASVYALGSGVSRPQYFHQPAGTALAATQLKFGPGTLHAVNVGTIGAAAPNVILYDSATVGGIGAANMICTIDTKNNIGAQYNFGRGLDFFAGLVATCGANNGDFVVTYE